VSHHSDLSLFFQGVLRITCGDILFQTMDTEYRQKIFNECLSPCTEPSKNRYNKKSTSNSG